MGRYSEFASLLSERLTELDRPAAWLAARLDVDPATVSRWVSGETRPKSPELVVRIADCLGVHDRPAQQAWLVAARYGYQPPSTPAPNGGASAHAKRASAGITGTGAHAGDGATTDESAPLPPQPWGEPGSPRSRGAGGAIFMAGPVALGLALAAGAAYVLARQRSWIDAAVGAAIGLAAAAVVLVALAVGWRWKRGAWPRLPAWAGLRPSPARHLLQIILAALLVSDLALWSGVGWAAIRDAGCGPLGCQPGAVRRFAIAEWKNLTRGASPYEDVWTEGTRRALYQKLSLLPGLAGIAADSPQVTLEARQGLDIWIDGSFQKISEVALSAAVFGRGGQFQQTVSVSGPTDESDQAIETVILATQDELARKIIATLQVALPAASAEAIGRTPTRSAEALHLNNEAAVLILGGDTANAEALLQKALDLDPAYADAHNNLGALLSLRGDTAGAIAEYQRASQLLPRYAVFHFNLGTAYRKAGELDAAISEFTQAIALDPTYVKALNNLADAYLEAGDAQKAGELLQQGLRLAPEAAYLHKNLGRVYLAEGRHAQAIQALNAAVQRSDVPYAEALFYLAQAQAAAGHRPEACAVLADYTRLADDDAIDAPDRPAAAKALAAALGCP